jgi:hypothetical protein
MKYTINTLIVGVVLILSSCGGDEHEGAKTYDYDRSDSLSIDYTRQTLTIRGNIKETSGFYLLLKSKGGEYNKSLVNAASNVSKYSSNFDKSINMGIYGADLNYLTVFEQTEDARSTVESISKLASSLGIESAFDKASFDIIVSTSDSLNLREKSNLVSKAFRNAEDQMYSEERALMGTLMISGGWIESVYLTSKVVIDSKIDPQGLSDFWVLVFNYESVLKMLNIFGEEADAKKMYDQYKTLDEVVKKITEKSKLNLDDIKELNLAVGKIRSSMI